MDGTITKPKVDFAAIEREIGAKVGFIIDPNRKKIQPEETRGRFRFRNALKLRRQ